MHRNHVYTGALLIGLLFAVPNVHADPVALDTTHTSSLVATVTEESDPSNSENVTSLPFTSAIAETDESESATVTPALTTSSLTLTFSLSDTDIGSTTSGTGTIYFIPAANVQYTLAGTVAANFSDDGLINADLYDVTTNTNVYNEGVSGGNTISLNSIGGPLTGPLTAGDIYEFQASASLDSPTDKTPNAITPLAALPTATLAGPISITFTQIPEPATMTTLLGLTAFAISRHQRRLETNQ